MIYLLATFGQFLSELEVDPTDGFNEITTEPTAFLDILMMILPYIAIAFVVVAIVVVLFIAYKYKTTKVKPISNEAVDYILAHLGGIENIVNADVDGNRIRIQVVQVSRCDLSAIKGLGALGIFVTGNTVKMMFPFDAMSLIDTIQASKKEVK